MTNYATITSPNTPHCPELISRDYIGHIEHAKHSISTDTLEKIAMALDVDTAKLLRPLTN